MLDGATVRLRGLASSRMFRVGAVALAMLLASVLALAGLSNQLFWDDEANTAIYARNLLEFGCLTAWDGRNLVGYSYGRALGEDLGAELRVPPLPAYVAAAGFWVLDGTTFKERTFSGRLPFVVAGVLSVGLLAVWLRRHLGRRFPWYLPPLILALSPAYLLYIRNCRYYALGVMFTLLVWVFWAPGSSRGGREPKVRRLYGSPRALAAWLVRCLGASAAVVLLIFTHYLNAASALATLPLFFLDRRYRQPRQYALLGVVYAAAAACGVRIRLTADPFAADYEPGGGGLDRWEHFYTNVLKFVRDVGTHEFVPWVVVAVFLLPWLLPGPTTLAERCRRLRPLARRGWTLVAIVLAYAVLAGFFTPADMGKGPTAEIRYVVPLIAVGSVMGGLAVVILWRVYRPLAGAALLLLLATNILHLGFLARRFDGTRAWWPPTLYRYVQEALHDYETGNEEIIALLAQLPEDTKVRVWDLEDRQIMVYPPMFYVPKLRYCDQLEETKKINVERVYPPFPQPTPSYLVRYQSRPDVWLVTPYLLRKTLDGLRQEKREKEYQVKKALRLRWYFTSKPEIPSHYFSSPPPDWERFQSMTVLVASQSPVADDPALKTDMTDAEAICCWGLAIEESGDIDGAIARLRQALKVDPNCLKARFHLGRVLRGEGKVEEAVEHFEAATKLDPQFVEAHRNLGEALQALGRWDEARYHYQVALELRPHSPTEHYNLGNILAAQGAIDQAIRHFRTALRYNPNYARARVELGATLFEQGKVDEAIAQYRETLAVWPNQIEAHANLGIALRTKAQAFEAKGQAGKAKQLREEAVAELGEALQRVPPKHSLAAEIRQMLYEERRDALGEVPPDRALAAKIQKMLDEFAASTGSKKSPKKPSSK